MLPQTGILQTRNPPTFFSDLTRTILKSATFHAGRLFHYRMGWELCNIICTGFPPQLRIIFQHRDNSSRFGSRFSLWIFDRDGCAITRCNAASNSSDVIGSRSVSENTSMSESDRLLMSFPFSSHPIPSHPTIRKPIDKLHGVLVCSQCPTFRLRAMNRYLRLFGFKKRHGRTFREKCIVWCKTDHGAANRPVVVVTS